MVGGLSTQARLAAITNLIENPQLTSEKDVDQLPLVVSSLPFHYYSRHSLHAVSLSSMSSFFPGEFLKIVPELNHVQLATTHSTFSLLISSPHSVLLGRIDKMLEGRAIWMSFMVALMLIFMRYVTKLHIFVGGNVQKKSWSSM